MYNLSYTPFSIIHFFSYSIAIELTDTDKYLPPDDPNITNLTVAHYDCEKQHYLKQFISLNVKECTEDHSNIQLAEVKTRVYVRAEAKRAKVFKCEAYATQERKICFQGSVKYQRVDGTVWNNKTLHHPITLDPLVCKNLIKYPFGTNKKRSNNFSFNRTFEFLEDHYFQESLEQFQTPFTVYKFNKMHTGTFTYTPVDKNWVYDPLKNPFHKCPAYHQFEVKFLSWRLSVSEVELT